VTRARACPLPAKKIKPAKKEAADAAPAAANPQPPESNEAPKNMNGGGAGGPAAPADTSNYAQLDVINGAIARYSSMKIQGAQKQNMTRMMDYGKLNPSQQKEAAMKDAKNRQTAAVELTSLEQLVTAGLLPKIPPAPEGKKYVLDVKAQVVRLENK